MNRGFEIWIFQASKKKCSKEREGTSGTWYLLMHHAEECDMGIASTANFTQNADAFRQQSSLSR